MKNTLHVERFKPSNFLQKSAQPNAEGRLRPWSSSLDVTAVGLSAAKLTLSLNQGPVVLCLGQLKPKNKPQLFYLTVPFSAWQGAKVQTEVHLPYLKVVNQASHLILP